ncbi:protein MIZU-KUSSEI 1 [Elaeis guineensis]|uniref:Protein MIZU-KUSSEI 1 n=1 Tax=Elaeis guineensis var. tenera TaxID=51953 RepID=A0A6I9S577_ELAGV|nr:protein MIZU-KUSSEI 1 [Elaeis guineensis]
MAGPEDPLPVLAAAPRRSAASPSTEYGQPMISSTAVTLVEPPRRRRPRRVLRLIRAICRTLPLFTPRCHLPQTTCKLLHAPPSLSSCSVSHLPSSRSTTASIAAASHVTGTLFGPRRGRVTLSLQENPRCFPSLVVEIPVQTYALLREMSSGMVRIALECEKRAPDKAQSRPSRLLLLDEPLWTVFCNGKKSGYGMRREATEEDLAVMETLRPVSMGVGVLPGRSDVEVPDGEVAYLRSGFEHVISSRDSETLYMVTPDGGNGPELSIFFVRI